MSVEARERVMALPSLGADMDFGTVVEWRVAPGDALAKGDIVAVVETEKSDIDIETWHAGTVTELLAEVGREIPVGAPLLRMTGDGIEPAPNSLAPAERQVSAEVSTIDSAPDIASVIRPTRRKAVEPPVEPPIDVVAEPAGTGAPTRAALADPVLTDRVLASPRARVAARERGIDLATVTGTGPQGAVVFGDVERAGTETHRVERASAEDPSRRASLRVESRQASMRRSIAQRMATANRDIPHYYLEADVDLFAALRGLERRNEAKSLAERIIPAALFLEATAQAAKKHPGCVGTWGENGFEPADGVDIAVAISLRQGGLVTPTITHADERTLDELMVALKELVSAARTGSLKSSWMVDAGITVTNLGDNGAARIQGVIFPPQVALVGFGRIETRPCVVDDQVLARPMVSVSFAGDHRATDGLAGSRFLSTLVDHLEQMEC